MLDKKQIKLVQIAVKKAGIRTAAFEGRYRLLLAKYRQPDGRPVTSCKQLNNTQLDDILAICEACGWKHPEKEADFYRCKIEQQGEIASFAQQEAIRHLSEDLGMNLLHLGFFIARMTKQKCESTAELSPNQAWKIIEALKAILKRKTGIKLESLKSIREYFDKKESPPPSIAFAIRKRGGIAGDTKEATDGKDAK